MVVADVPLAGLEELFIGAVVEFILARVASVAFAALVGAVVLVLIAGTGFLDIMGLTVPELMIGVTNLESGMFGTDMKDGCGLDWVRERERGLGNGFPNPSFSSSSSYSSASSSSSSKSSSEHSSDDSGSSSLLQSSSYDEILIGRRANRGLGLTKI